MKNILCTTLLSLLILSVIGCSKDDKTVAPGITAAQVNTIITEGSWKVTSYTEAGTDEASNFSSYTFSFSPEGVLTATGVKTKVGTWNSTTDSGLVIIPIAFASEVDGPFEAITEDWSVLTCTDLKLELKHTSGDDGSIDLLSFEKI
jgi:hypothetical protein